MTVSPSDILKKIVEKAAKAETKPVRRNRDIFEKIAFVSRCEGNRAAVRVLLACALAKLDRPEIDPRKPYTKIEEDDCFSGRWYDEEYIGKFIRENRLPCNSTTAFLTPALRNRNTTLTVETELEGRPPEVYHALLALLGHMANGRVTAEQVLVESTRNLIQLRDERDTVLKEMLGRSADGSSSLPLSSDQIVTLLTQHLACKHSSRLPVLMVFSAYEAVVSTFGEVPAALRGHLSADEQTGASGDVEIRLANDDRICTVYEMKSKRVTKDDLERSLEKIATHQLRVDNYVFITTEPVDQSVSDFAKSLYESTHGIEFAILDCIGFIRHYLHFFHRHRIKFLDVYQQRMLVEPESSVNHALKEAFLSLRRAAQVEG